MTVCDYTAVSTRAWTPPATGTTGGSGCRRSNAAVAWSDGSGYLGSEVEAVAALQL